MDWLLNLHGGGPRGGHDARPGDRNRLAVGPAELPDAVPSGLLGPDRSAGLYSRSGRGAEFRDRPNGGSISNAIAREQTIQALARDIELADPFENDYDLVGNEHLQNSGGSLRGEFSLGPVLATTITGLEQLLAPAGSRTSTTLRTPRSTSSRKTTPGRPPRISASSGSPIWFRGSAALGRLLLARGARLGCALPSPGRSALIRNRDHPALRAGPRQRRRIRQFQLGFPRRLHTRRRRPLQLGAQGVRDARTATRDCDGLGAIPATAQAARRDLVLRPQAGSASPTTSRATSPRTGSTRAGGRAGTSRRTRCAAIRGLRAVHAPSQHADGRRARDDRLVRDRLARAMVRRPAPAGRLSLLLPLRGLPGVRDREPVRGDPAAQDHQCQRCPGLRRRSGLLASQPLRGWVPGVLEGLTLSGRFGWIESEFLDFTDTRDVDFTLGTGATDRVQHRRGLHGKPAAQHAALQGQRHRGVQLRSGALGNARGALRHQLDRRHLLRSDRGTRRQRESVLPGQRAAGVRGRAARLHAPRPARVATACPTPRSRSRSGCATSRTRSTRPTWRTRRSRSASLQNLIGEPRTYGGRSLSSRLTLLRAVHSRARAAGSSPSRRAPDPAVARVHGGLRSRYSRAAARRRSVTSGFCFAARRPSRSGRAMDRRAPRAAVHRAWRAR